MTRYALLTIGTAIVFLSLIALQWDRIVHSPHAAWLGPALLMALFSFVTEIPMWLYYKKNAHLAQMPRLILFTGMRLIILGFIIADVWGYF